jgi:hypothetical protein
VYEHERDIEVNGDTQKIPSTSLSSIEFLRVTDRIKMGAAIHRATRVFRMYNIDNRVEKVLSRDKPTPAPKHAVERQSIQINTTEGNDYLSLSCIIILFILDQLFR